MRHTDNSILKDTLQPNILRTWISIHANSLIKTSVNIMKRKSMKVPGKISVTQKSEVALQKTLHQNISHFTYFICFFVSQINLVFKLNLMLIDILDDFCHNLFSFSLPFDISLILNFI